MGESDTEGHIPQIVAQPYCRMCTPTKLCDNLVASLEDLANLYRIEHARIIERQGLFLYHQRCVYDLKTAKGKGDWGKRRRPDLT